MAITYVLTSPASSHGQLVISTIGGLRAFMENLKQLVDPIQGVLPRMLNGDPNDLPSYAQIATFLGITGATSNADAKALKEELEALYFKMTTNGSQTDVYAAIQQAIAKFYR